MIRKNKIVIKIIMLVIMLLYCIQFSKQHPIKKKIFFSDVIKNIFSRNISEISFKGNYIEGAMKNGSTFYSIIPDFYNQIIDDMIYNDIKFEIISNGAMLTNVVITIISYIPLILLLIVWFILIKNNINNEKLFNIKNNFPIAKSIYNNILFSDIGGNINAKESLSEIINFLKHPEKFEKLGGRMPTGFLLVGSPGTGKTMLAKAVSCESSTPFFSVSGSDFVEMFVGVGARRIRSIFSEAAKCSPCIIFIDEIDAIGKSRNVKNSHDEREQTLNQLLIEMDGFHKNSGIVVIAATNRPEVLDPALIRSGRFDRRIKLHIPTLLDRREIISIYTDKIPMSKDFSIDELSISTIGFSGSDICKLINEASLLASKNNKESLSNHEIEISKDILLMGNKMNIKSIHNAITAYHEAGHVLAAFHYSYADYIHKVTIVPRDHSLGAAITYYEKDKYNHTKRELNNKILVMISGRAAEEIIFGIDNITTGASNDIENASLIADNMVNIWGFSNLGIFANNKRKISDYFLRRVDYEIKAIIDMNYKKALNVISKNINALHIIAKSLLRYETLTGSEIKYLLRNN